MSEIERGTHDPSFGLVERLATATGHRLVAVPTDAPAAYETAQRLTEILDEDPTPRGYERGLTVLVDFSRRLAAQDGPTRVALTVTRPASTGSAHFDAALAAAVEHWLAPDGLAEPDWVGEPTPRLPWPWMPDPEVDPRGPSPLVVPFVIRGIIVNEAFFDGP